MPKTETTAKPPFKGSRLLTVAMLRKRQACIGGIERFRAIGGDEQVIDHTWAERAAKVLDAMDISWGARELLPPGWHGIYLSIRDEHDQRLMVKCSWELRVRVRAAIFAALYVEAGKP